MTSVHASAHVQGPAPEDQVTDKVRLVAPLASGGMGTVWLARHRDLSSEVVVKLISSARLRDDPEAPARFMREAKIISRLGSPHVVRVFDAGVSEAGVPYIVMERLHGETLAKRLERGPLPLGAVVKLIEQVATALDEAHRLGVVHRDIKPANVILVETALGCFAKVLDFGVAKLLDAEDHALLTQAGALMGTPAYMSPEQLLDASDIDHRSDLWSLAVMAYEALTGERPFSGSSVTALSLTICAGDFAPPSTRRRDLPQAIDRWFVRALSVSTADRYPSAVASASALADAAGQPLALTAPEYDEPAMPSSAEPAPLGTTLDARSRVSRRRRIGPKLTIGAAAIVVLLVVLTSERRPDQLHVRSAPLLQSSVTALRRPPVIEPPRRDATAVAEVEPPRPDATAVAKVEPPTVVPLRSPRRARGGSVAAPVRPRHCATDEGFITDARGVLQPRPECL